MAEGDTLLNAVVGGIASIVLSFIPLSPVLGGAIADYLEGGDRSTGLRIGVYAGIVAAIPLALFLVAAIAIFGSVLAIGPGDGGGATILVVFVVVLVFMALYTVGLSAFGGWLGNYVRYDTDLFE